MIPSTMTLKPKLTPTAAIPPKLTLTATIPHKQTQPTLPTKLTAISLLLVTLFLNKNFAFNSDFLDNKNSDVYFRRKTCDTNVINYTLINFTNFNNKVSTTIFPVLVLGMAYRSDDSFPSNDASQWLNLNNVLYMPLPVSHMNIEAFSSIFHLPDYTGQVAYQNIFLLSHKNKI